MNQKPDPVIVAGREAPPHVDLPVSVLADRALSAKAKAVYAVMLAIWNRSYEPVTQIAVRGYLREGPDALRAATRELEDAGLVVRERLRDKGRIAGTHYIVPGGAPREDVPQW